MTDIDQNRFALLHSPTTPPQPRPPNPLERLHALNRNNVLGSYTSGDSLDRMARIAGLL
jgi:hypothetical protein